MLNWSKVKTLNKWVGRMQADDTPLGDTTMKIIFIAIVLVVILTLPLDENQNFSVRLVIM